MKKIIDNFLLMLQFMTRLPINKSLPCELTDFRSGASMLPFVGFIIGGLQWLVFYILVRILPLNIVSAITILCGVLLTGALHVDGLGDCADGFYAFKGKDKIIEIMKDSRIGTYACVAILLDLLIKYSSIASIRDINSSLIIVLVPVIARACLVLIATIGKNAKPTGSGNLFIGNLGFMQVVIAFLITLIIAVFLVGPFKALVLISTAIVTTFLFNKYCNFKLNGLTGDTLGANTEIVELVVFIVFIALGRVV